MKKIVIQVFEKHYGRPGYWLVQREEEFCRDGEPETATWHRVWPGLEKMWLCAIATDRKISKVLVMARDPLNLTYWAVRVIRPEAEQENLPL